MCHHALRNVLPLSFVIGWSFLDMVMCRKRLPRSASSSSSTFLVFAVDVSSNLWKRSISGMWRFTFSCSLPSGRADSRRSGVMLGPRINVVARDHLWRSGINNVGHNEEPR
ncbi:hypothetical protein EDD22DRAFT_871232 [Suillus occidentalis]|nr:hypothetical protein EDD22DRAFT_871232 [Suillus occidentalis]